MPVPELVDLLTPEVDAGLRQLMCLDDAIAHRLHVLAQPCADCPPGARCTEHAGDQALIGSYRRWHASVLNDLLAGFNPDEVRAEMSRGDGTPPTAIAMAMLIQARVRELAADGPVVARDDRGVLLFERDGTHVHGFPLDEPA
jgi:hypothetical protein